MTRSSRFSTLLEQAGMLLVLALLVAACAAFVPNFRSFNNMQGLLLAVASVGIVSCSMLFCLASGNFDLSVGAVAAASGVLCALVMQKTGSIALGLAAGLGLGLFVGLVNGFIVARCKINPLITTLATMQIVRGVSLLLNDGKSVGIGNEKFYALGKTEWWSFPVPVWICFAFFVIFGIVLQRTIFGRYTLAVGGNENAARLAGVPVENVKMAIFVVQGMVAAFAGLITASRMTMADPKPSEGFELAVISACILGGVSLTGGVGTMSFVVAGVFIMGTVDNAMALLNLPTFYQYVARGAILLGAVLFDRYKQRR